MNYSQIIVQVAVALLTGGIVYLIFYLKSMYDTRTVANEIKRNTTNNIFPIINSEKTDMLSSLYKSCDSMITIDTYQKFSVAYSKFDIDKDIHIVLHTPGGQLTGAEAIVNVILNHKGKGKVYCYIPFYAYSAGCFIAMACDKIYMHVNAILGPCDAQKSIGVYEQYSVAAIEEAVDYQKNRQMKIDTKWLAHNHDAKLCKSRQRETLDTLIKRGKIDEMKGNQIYDQFYSGIHNHDKIFTAQNALDLGLNIEIVTEFPTNIMQLINDKIKN